MKIKTKLTLGVGLLFMMILLLSIVSARYMYQIKAETENIWVNNYRTLEYSKNMLKALENGLSVGLKKFEENLRNQEQNVTEIYESETTSTVRILFDSLSTHHNDSNLVSSIRLEIFKIMEMNMQSIQFKSELAKKTTENAVFWIAITGTLCFLIAFVLLINLPAHIGNPISELTESIKEIAAKNYSKRVNFETHSEFGDLARSFNTMAKKLDEYNQSNLSRLLMEKKRIDTLIDKMQDPVIGLNEKMEIIFINQEANHILGMPDTELLGFSARDLALKNDLIRVLIKDILDIEYGTLNHKPLTIFSNKKESFFLKDTQKIEIIPTGEKQPQLVGYVILLRNVTEYKELDTAKTNFIATVSHEFKTPISSIKMSLQLLENSEVGTLNEEQKNLINSIHEDANRLLKITRELLNITQVESGKIKVFVEASEPGEILDRAIDATKIQAENKNIQLKIDHGPNHLKMMADKEKTEWILTNLISNAIRYSYENSTIDLRIEEIEKHVAISVQDYGQGIAPQYLKRIFERYFRVPGSRKEGTGLGLAISKQFIEAQHGEILVESEFGAGSTFCIKLPKIIDETL